MIFTSSAFKFLQSAGPTPMDKITKARASSVSHQSSISIISSGFAFLNPTKFLFKKSPDEDSEGPSILKAAIAAIAECQAAAN